MNILFITLGSAGDVNPLVALGIGLRKRGHAVMVVSSGFFRELISGVGLGFIEIGSKEAFQALIENPDVWNPRKGLELLLRHAFLPALRPVYEIIAKQPSRDTIVVSSTFMYGARIAHEKLGTALVTVNLQPAAFWSVYDPPVMPLLSLPRWLPVFGKRLVLNTIDALLDRVIAPEVNAFRKEVGLPAIAHLFSRWAPSPQKVIGLFPDWFSPPAPDWPPQTQLTGFISFDPGEEDSLPPEALDFLDSGDPPLVFTPGTAMLHGAKFFEVSVASSLLLKKRALLLTPHRAHLPRHLPHEILHFDYLPLSTVLPRSALLVHHGGIGTAVQGLAAGIPQVVMPMNFDQPDNAARLERLGVGVSLSPWKFRVPELAEKLGYLLSSGTVQENCARWKKRIDFGSTLEDACTTIEGVLSKG